eukprot:GILJ01020063.1.p1 GENE.GILJ01020063.1~~GILJ01020063.1.p1  ORF type:complete len:274 (-),score=28.65 GILJ01020063.1:225-1046(-)
MEDRMADLRQMTPYHSSTPATPPSLLSTDPFFTFVNEIRSSLRQVSSQIEEIEKSYKADKSVDDGLVAKTQKDIQAIKATIERYNDAAYPPDRSRIRRGQMQQVTIKLKNIVSTFYRTEAERKRRLRAGWIRQARIVDPSLTESQVDDFIDKGGDPTNLFVGQIMGTGASSQTRNAVVDIQDKYRDIRRLEQQIGELHQLFIDLSTLVGIQGDILNHIESTVSSTKEYVRRGEAELSKAKRLQRRAFKKMCCVICILVVVLVVILAPILKLSA